MIVLLILPKDINNIDRLRLFLTVICNIPLWAEDILDGLQLNLNPWWIRLDPFLLEHQRSQYGNITALIRVTLETHQDGIGIDIVNVRNVNVQVQFSAFVKALDFFTGHTFSGVDVEAEQSLLVVGTEFKRFQLFESSLLAISVEYWLPILGVNSLPLVVPFIILASFVIKNVVSLVSDVFLQTSHAASRVWFLDGGVLGLPTDFLE